MTGLHAKRGFTLLEMLVASLLLSMMVVALSMVFSSSASAWRIGRAGVSGLHDVRKTLSKYQLTADNALPNLKGRGNGFGFVRSVWMNSNGSALIDQDGESVDGRGFDTQDIYGGKSGLDISGPSHTIQDLGSIRGNTIRNYIVGVGSAGPDRIWDTKDDIATWPGKTGGGI